MKKYFLVLIILFLTNCNDNRLNFNNQFQGKINNKYPITMQINSVNGKIKGFYYYDKFKNRIELEGKILGDSIVLQGTDSKGNLIDIFQGVLYNNMSIKGYWSMPKKDKISQFYLNIKKDEPSIYWPYLTLLFMVIVGGILFIFYKKRDSKEFGKAKKNKLKSNITVIKNETKNSFDVGLDFEKFVTTLFPKQYYKLLDWRSDKSFEGVYPESNMKPDLFYKRLNSKNKNSSFAIECKFRKSQYKNGVTVSGKDQLKRYQEFYKAENVPVFIVLGMGNEPNNPLKLFIIPINSINTPDISFQKLKSFEVKIRKYLFYDPELKTLK